jgi:predicted component of type VI protein secretion system
MENKMKFIMLCVLVLVFSGCSNTEKNKENPPIKKKVLARYIKQIQVKRIQLKRIVAL